MNASRIKPEILKKETLQSPPKSSDDSMGCITLPLGIVISYFITSAVVKSMLNTATKLEQYVCYGTLVFFVIMAVLAARDRYKESQARAAERAGWASSCKTECLNIVSRQKAKTTSWWDDYSYRYHNYRRPNLLMLEMNTQQRAVSPDQTMVSVEVSHYIYKRLEQRKTVRIYYMPESPLTFLLEEEL